MSKSIYLTAAEPRAGKTVVALGLMELLAERVDRIAVFRPVVPTVTDPDPLLDLLLRHYNLDQDYASAVGFTYARAAELASGADFSRLLPEIAQKHAALTSSYDAVLVIGTDYTGPERGTEFLLNAELATNLGAPVIAVVPAALHVIDRVVGMVTGTRQFLVSHGCSVVAMVVNRVPPGSMARLRAGLDEVAGPADPPSWALPEISTLAAVSMAELVTGLGAVALSAPHVNAHRDIDGVVVGSGHADMVLDVLREQNLIVAAGDRADLAVTAAAATTSAQLPTPSGVLLTCGVRPSPAVMRLLDSAAVPVAVTDLDTYGALRAMEGLDGEIRVGSTRKIAAAVGEFTNAVDTRLLGERIQLAHSSTLTPLMFQLSLMARARADRRRIVLPESGDSRILRAAEQIIHTGAADLVLLGDPARVTAKAATLGVDLGATEIIDPAASPMRAKYAAIYADARAHKGMTLDAAWDMTSDPTYFGTLMVATGAADGMVSGAVSTTAHTIRPALEIIRTAPGVSLVSSAFFMCLPHQVVVFADCAVIPDPNAQQLAEIAAGAAQTARAFGVEPRVAMLSYSTGTSGSGADVEKVRQATDILTAAHPELPVAGPIQYDAAVDPEVGQAKMPGNPVAGHATVFVFPDLNTGNNTYKAVQRSSDAIAVGPVLMGLAKPVNDLSRGCTVADIVNTVAITAVQAQTQARTAASMSAANPEPGPSAADVGAGDSLSESSRPSGSSGPSGPAGRSPVTAGARG